MEATTVTPGVKQYPHDYLAAELGGSSQLDAIETTVRHHLPNCFSEYRRKNFTDEYQAAVELYGELDYANNGKKLQQLKECRKYAYFARHSETGEVRVIANACKLRWCPVCADAKRVRIKAAVSKWLKTVKRPKFLTLTMSHTSDSLDAQVKALYKAFRLLRKHKAIKDRLRGGIWFFQVKRDKARKYWHPHLHICLDSDYIDKKLLSMEWLNVTGNSYIIDIRAIEDPGKVADYVSRYCAKPCIMSDFTQTDRIEIATVLHGKRLCGRFGSGAQCDFTASTHKDFTVWQRLGSWVDIVVNRHDEPVFRKILRAYLSHESIESGLCEHLIRQNSPDQMSPPPFTPGVKDPQLHLSDFAVW